MCFSLLGLCTARASGSIPADNVVREFFDTYFPDSYLDLIFPHMEYVGKPELPSAPPPKA